MDFALDNDESIRQAKDLRASNYHGKAAFNYNEKMGDKAQSDVDQNGLFLAPMETEQSNWDLSDFDGHPDRSMTGSMYSLQPDEQPRPLRAKF